MDRGNSAEIPADDFNWRDRSEYWRNYRPITRGNPKKYKYREPLILCGHGVRIRANHNTLLIRNGFTHYPQKSEEIRLFPGDPNLPDRIIILDGSGGISFDALNWLTEQKINFVQLNWRGEVSVCSSATGFCANLKLVEAQKRAKSGSRGPQIAAWLIAGKLNACISVLENRFPKSEIRDSAIIRHRGRYSEIREKRNSITISRLFGIEGDCAQSYFAAWRGLPIKWSGTTRKPIPNSWLEIAPRTIVWKKRAYVARHPVNAMLNYGYGIVIHAIQSKVIATGLDPAIGIIHGNRHNAIPLIYDLMEPMRPIVDQAVLQLILSHDFKPGDFTINKMGGCRLNPQMAKTVVNKVSKLDAEELVRSFRQLL